MTKVTLPAWAQTEENYIPNHDRDFFISRTLLKLMSVLCSLRHQDRSRYHHLPATGSLMLVMLLTLLIACAQTPQFLLTVLAGEMLLLCVIPADIVLLALKRGLIAMLFSAFLLLPGLLLKSGFIIWLIPARTFLIVIMLTVMTLMLPWHRITAALAWFHIPGLVIAILDITLKYIGLLGGLSLQMLQALKLRSVGNNPHKGQALSGVLGMTFLKSQEMATEMFAAMRCRGFTGDYPHPEKGDKPATMAKYLTVAAVYCCLFLLLEIVK